MRLLLVHDNPARSWAPLALAGPALPAGPLLLAKAARAAGHEVERLGLPAAGDAARRWPAALSAALRQAPVDAIGLSLLSLDRPGGGSTLPGWSAVAQAARAADLPVVLGGAAFSLAPRACLERLDAGLGVVGSGEASLVGLLDELAAGVPADALQTPGVLARGRDGTERSSIQPVAEAPPTHGLVVDGPPALLVRRPPCPDVQGDLSGPDLRVEPPDLAEVEGLVDELRRGVADDGLAGQVCALVDPWLNQPTEWAKELLAAIIRAELPLGFTACLRPHLDTDRELVGLLRRAGCLLARCRVTSPPGSVEGGRLCGYLDDHRLPYVLELVLGGPGETRASVEGAFAWLARCDPARVELEAGPRLLPGHELLWGRAAEQGRVAVDEALDGARYVSPAIERDWLARRIRQHRRWHWPRLTQRLALHVQRWSLARSSGRHRS